MTQEQARVLMERVQREAPAVQATFEEVRRRKDGKGYSVKVQLVGRVMAIHDVEEWESLWQAWQGLVKLPEQKPEQPMKMCTWCHHPFPATTKYFPANAQVECGLRNQCKRCRSAQRTVQRNSLRAQERAS